MRFDIVGRDRIRDFHYPRHPVHFIQRILTLHTSVRRTVVVGGREYTVDIMASSPLHRDRLGNCWYVQVELPGVWKAVFGAPPGIEDMSHLLYPQLIDYVHEAQRLVAMRRSDHDAPAAD